jgi:hypothetical protein
VQKPNELDDQTRQRVYPEFARCYELLLPSEADKRDRAKQVRYDAIPPRSGSCHLSRRAREIPAVESDITVLPQFTLCG